MRILVTGALGRLGSQLVETLTVRKHEVVGCDVGEFDIGDFHITRAAIAAIKPDLVIHPAAWTDVEGCAREPEKAVHINGFGTQHIALASAAVGAAVLYISTNEVFAGTANRPYREYDVTNPINPYGYSKWVGERALMHLNPRHYIVRPAWMFSHGGKNFIQSILDAAAANKPLRVVLNEVANPTYANDAAEAIASLVETERFGIYHFVNEGACSRFEFARYILDRAGYADTHIEPISAIEWKRLSTPPPYAAMDNCAGKLLGITLRPWQQAVDAFLQREKLLTHES
jgi:dTDP-4-dehydrorhamnose reductase